MPLHHQEPAAAHPLLVRLTLVSTGLVADGQANPVLGEKPR